MSMQTIVRTRMPDRDDPEDRVDESWSIRTYPSGDEWWSEILDGHQHPHVDHDEHGYDTVRRFFGETVQQSRDAALEQLKRIVVERGGEVLSVSEVGSGDL